MLAGLLLVALLGSGGVLTGYLVQRGDPGPIASAPAAPAPGGPGNPAKPGGGISTIPAGPGNPAKPGSGSTTGPAESGSPKPAAAVNPGGFAPVVCNDPAPANAPVAPQRGAATGVNGWALLDGWSYFTDGTGLHMPVPDGWTYQRIGTTYCFRDPDGGRMLTLDVGRRPSGDPVQACRAEAARLVEAGALPGYQQIAIEAKPLLNKAADWEYRYRDPRGTAMHAQTRWFSTGGRAFAISWSTREIDWPGDLAKLNMVLSTFYADPVQ